MEENKRVLTHILQPRVFFKATLLQILHSHSIFSTSLLIHGVHLIISSI